MGYWVKLKHVNCQYIISLIRFLAVSLFLVRSLGHSAKNSRNSDT